MEAQTFLDNFATVADAQDGIQRLRYLVLSLAVNGRLVEQDRSAEPALTALKRIAAQRKMTTRGPSLRSRNTPVSDQPPDSTRVVPLGWAQVRLGDAFLVVMGVTSTEVVYETEG